jgi:hypothetical protein
VLRGECVHQATNAEKSKARSIRASPRQRAYSHHLTHHRIVAWNFKDQNMV